MRLKEVIEEGLFETRNRAEDFRRLFKDPFGVRQAEDALARLNNSIFFATASSGYLKRFESDDYREAEETIVRAEQIKDIALLEAGTGLMLVAATQSRRLRRVVLGLGGLTLLGLSFVRQIKSTEREVAFGLLPDRGSISGKQLSVFKKG